MTSLGYLLLFSLLVALICPTSGYYVGRSSCPGFGTRTNCGSVSPCTQDSDCLSGQSCCPRICGVGLHCYSVNGFLNSMGRLFSCRGCGGCSSGGCTGRCSGCDGYGGGYGLFGKK